MTGEAEKKLDPSTSGGPLNGLPKFEDLPKGTFDSPQETPAKGKARKAKAKAKAKPNVNPDGLADEAQAVPETPSPAQDDAADAFMKATSKAQAFKSATDGMLGAVRLGLPDPDVYFRVLPIKEIVRLDKTKVLENTAIVSLYKSPDGSRASAAESRLWLVADDLVPAFRERRAKVRDYQLRLAVDRQGTPYLIPVPIGASDIWGASLANCVQIAETTWIKMYTDPIRGRLHEPGDDQDLQPAFPKEPFAKIYTLALMPIFISSKDHFIYKRICGQ